VANPTTSEPLEMPTEHTSVAGQACHLREDTTGCARHNAGGVVADRPSERPSTLTSQVAGADQLGEARQRFEANSSVGRTASEVTPQHEGGDPGGRYERDWCHWVRSPPVSNLLKRFWSQHDSP